MAFRNSYYKLLLIGLFLLAFLYWWDKYFNKKTLKYKQLHEDYVQFPRFLVYIYLIDVLFSNSKKKTFRNFENVFQFFFSSVSLAMNVQFLSEMVTFHSALCC